MSGYLQRLAASALRPAEAVNPVLGSVFSPQDGLRDHQTFPQEEDTTVSVNGAAAPLISPTGPALGSEQTSPPFGDTPHSNVVGIRSSSDFRTLEPEVLPSKGSRKRDSFQPLLPDFRHEASPTPTTPQELLVVEHLKPSPQPAYSPLVPSSFARSSPTIAGAQAPANSSSFRGYETNATASRSAKSEPDEIQIHIGRIEVTAVPQTSARAASRPGRKGISLDEYLKGRDRRA